MTDLTARITEILREHVERQLMNYDTGFEECGCGQQGVVTYDEHVATFIAAAAEEHYRPRIETPEQLDALPVGVIVADLHCDLTPPPVYVRFIDGWSLDGLKVKPGRRNLTVLWSPGASDE